MKQKLNKTLRLNFRSLKSICFFHPRYHPEIKGDILKKCTNNKCVCFNDVFMNNGNKNEAEIKNRSQRDDINRPKPRHGPK